MNIAASSLQLGPYTVQQRQEPDRQWPLWWVFLGTVLIGKCFSRPCESDCVWLYRQQLQQTVYAFSATSIPHRWAERNAIKRSRAVYRRGGGRKTKGQLARELAEAIDS